MPRRRPPPDFKCLQVTKAAEVTKIAEITKLGGIFGRAETAASVVGGGPKTALLGGAGRTTTAFARPTAGLWVGVSWLKFDCHHNTLLTLLGSVAVANRASRLPGRAPSFRQSVAEVLPHQRASAPALPAAPIPCITSSLLALSHFCSFRPLPWSRSAQMRKVSRALNVKQCCRNVVRLNGADGGGGVLWM